MTEQIIEQVKRDATELNGELVSAIMGELITADNIGEVESRTPIALAAALDVIAAHWRNEASLRRAANKRGAKGLQERDEHAASLIAAIAIDLRRFEPAADVSFIANHVLSMPESPDMRAHERMWPSEPEIAANHKALDTVDSPDDVIAADVARGVDEDCYCGLPLDGHPKHELAAPEPTTRIPVREVYGWGEHLDCAPETCGGTSYDPCHTAWQTKGVRHDGYFARPGLDDQCRAGTKTGDFMAELDYCLRFAKHDGEHDNGKTQWKDAPRVAIPEIYAGQCPSEEGQERCMLPTGHTGLHTGTKGAKWEETAPTLNRDTLKPDTPAPPAPGDPGYCERCDTATHICKGCGDHVEHDQGADCGKHDGPVIVGPAYTPKVLDIRRLSWAELAVPPANADAIRPAHRSISQVETYEGCGLKYRLQRYGETVDVPSWAREGGKAIHTVIEGMETAVVPWSAVIADVWPKIFDVHVKDVEESSGISRDLWIEGNGGKENEAWWRVEGEAMLRRYLAWRKAMMGKGWRLVAVEAELRSPALGDGQPARLGYLDQAWYQHTTRTLLLIDEKSGRNKPQSRFQLNTYGRHIAANGVGDVKPDDISAVRAGYLMLRRGDDGPAELIEEHDVMKDGASAAEIDFRFANMDRAERAGVYLPHPSNLCGSCGVRAGCPVGRPAATS